MINSTLMFKIAFGLTVMVLLILSLLLWSNTPQLFDSFNQAFCAH